MTDQIRNLLISLASHMAYMQGQLEAFTDQSDPEDFYWYRESVTLRQKVTDALAAAADGPAVPDGREPASVATQPSDEEIIEFWSDHCAGDGDAGIIRLARWGTSNLTETRRSLKDAWAAHQPAIEAAAKAGMEACRMDEPAVPEGREPASVMGEPSDEELLELHNWMTDEWAANHDFELPPSQFARAVLARYGRTAPAPAGEVAELVAALRNDAINCTCSTLTSGDLRRAADILEQRHAAPVPVASDVHFEFVVSDADYCTQARGIAPTYAQAVSEGQHYLAQYQQDGLHTLEVRRVEVLPAPVPVAVSERLPQPEDCDAEGRCWLLTVEDDYPQWRLHSIEGSQPGGATMIWVPVDSTSGVMVDCFYTSHWLPANALPVPNAEPQP